MNLFDTIIEPIGAWVMNVISTLGYAGVVVCMAIESACIPLPSEIIMPFSGSLVATGRFDLWLASLAGAFGCLVGSIVAYVAGYYGGRPFIEKYGKWILLSERELAWADWLFTKYGSATVFVTRLLPVIRTFISLPAGIARMHFGKFCIYTFVGSFPWCLALAYVGLKMGENWREIRHYFHKFDVVIGVVLLLGVVAWIYLHVSHVRKNRRKKAEAASSD
ncbi:MAG: DedA family protein [Candidatus Coatesbacteria bacterium]|nr:MAG: DedA family protein [Candidatus Coatesbacteria bacterium]